MRKKIYLNLAHMGGKEMDFIQEAFDTNWIVPLGPNVNGFEQDLKKYAGNTHEVVALASGTAAVHLSLIACGVQAGDEVIVQSFTFCASSHPITYLGATPVFVDSEPDTWNMDPQLLEEAILDRIAKTGRKPKAIIPVALYGMPYKIEELLVIANKYDIPIIEDAAEGLGSRFDGKMLGTFGRFGVLSFNGNKMITTSGGGAIICPTHADRDKIMWYATQAREAYSYYQHEAIGYNYRLSNVCAGIGRGQMLVLDEHIAHHHRVQALYEKLLADVPGIMLHKQPVDSRFDSNYWLSTIILDESVKVINQEKAYAAAITSAIGGAAGVIHVGGDIHTDCEPNANVEALRIALDAAGIESRPLWKPMHCQPVYKNSPAYTNGVSEELFKHGLCLPAGPMVTDEDVYYIVSEIKKALYMDNVVLTSEPQNTHRHILFSPPDISEKEVKLVTEALRSGWITTGSRTKQFEAQLANYCKTSKVVCLNSATACMEMVLRILGVGPDDEVIVPAYTYTATASIVCHVGAKVVMVDSQTNSYEMDYDALLEAITPRTKVIIPVDLAGIVCDYDKIYKAIEAKKDLFVPTNRIQEAFNRIVVLADSAHALGATWRGKMCGEIADFTSFSFHAVKNLTTAEGGAVTWKDIPCIDNDWLYHQFQLLSLHGQSKDALTKTKLGAWEYDILTPAYKCNMTDIMAAVGLAQFGRYPGMLARRREIITRYNEAFKQCNIEWLNHLSDDHLSSGHLYMVNLIDKDEAYRNRVITQMAEKGIACNVHYKPLPMMTAYRDLGFDIQNYPNAYKHYQNEITLPLHTCLSDEDVDYVIESFLEILNETNI